MNKRGISAIVATVLIILITVAAVTIIWVAIIPMISRSEDIAGTDVRLDIVTTSGYTFYDPNDGTAYVQIKRGPDTAEIIKIHIIFSIAGNSETFIVNGSAIPTPNGMTSIKLPVSGKPDTVRIIPVYLKDGTERMGTASEVKIKESTAINPAEDGDYTPATNLEGETVVDAEGNLVLPPEGEFTPLSISGLVVWLDAKKGVVYDPANNRVSEWQDQSGNGNNASSSGLNRPYYNPSVDGISGAPAITFFETDISIPEYNHTRLTIPEFIGGEISQPDTIFVVGKRSSRNIQFQIIHGRHFFDGIEKTKRQFNKIGPFFNSSWLATENTTIKTQLEIISSDYNSIGQWQIHTNLIDGDSSLLRINNFSKEWEQQGILNNANLSGLTIGNKYEQEHNKNDLDGMITEIIIYDSRLSDEEISLVESYLKNKYTIVVPSCTDGDGDGFCDDVDCNDADDNINPGISENCYDLIDNDCSGAIDDCIDLTGLAAWWKMDEIDGNGNPLDYLGNYDGTKMDDAVQSSGKFGQGFSFDGVNDYINITDPSAINITGNEASFSVWIKPNFLNDVAPPAKVIFDRGGEFRAVFNPGVDEFRFTIDNGTNSENCDTQGVSWNIGEWHHFAGSYNGTNMNVYWDGVLNNTCAQTGNIKAVDGNFYIGSDSTLILEFNGSIDEVMIFNRSLTPSEINTLYTGTSF